MCNPVALERIGRDRLPYDACASAVLFGDAAGRIVRVFKDQGEQRLSSVMASCMLRTVPQDWTYDAVTFVPATLSAYRYRGFDHAELIARAIASSTGSGCAPLLARPKARDQRKLSAMQRIANLSGSFHVREGAISEGLPGRVLLVDDVYTTGSTLCAAADALRLAGVREIRCLTFARV